ncbi:MAG: hypothetical protein JW915_02650 [Chitinispirillaceae bacterium]|nr:hypothetical protein [Chitinispirillaceae bacterium]
MVVLQEPLSCATAKSTKRLPAFFYNTKVDVTIRDCFIGPNAGYSIGYYNSSTPHTNVHDNYSLLYSFTYL